MDDDPLPDPHGAGRRRDRALRAAGPTCDSVDVLYEKDPYFLPFSLEIGSKVLIEGTGLYDDLFGRRLQRLPAARDACDLTVKPPVERVSCAA